MHPLKGAIIINKKTATTCVIAATKIIIYLHLRKFYKHIFPILIKLLLLSEAESNQRCNNKNR